MVSVTVYASVSPAVTVSLLAVKASDSCGDSSTVVTAGSLAVLFAEAVTVNVVP